MERLYTLNECKTYTKRSEDYQLKMRHSRIHQQSSQSPVKTLDELFQLDFTKVEPVQPALPRPKSPDLNVVLMQEFTEQEL